MPRPNKTRLCTFRLEHRLYGLGVPHVLEILRAPALTPVPQASPAIRGLINLRGQILTALDLRVRLGLDPAPPDSSLMGLIVRGDNEAVILLVDHVEGVLDVDPKTYEPTPETVDSKIRALVRGAYKLDEELILLLNLEESLMLSSDIKGIIL